MDQDCCCAPVADTAACGCCEGVGGLTPLDTANRPGLSALRYRVGTHATFLETMQARLAGDDSRLAGLTTRDSGDFSLALLDAWATVADVLTFYQERIANEGYLRTATERRSLLEMARLVGYKPRPGVASSVYLAYTLDEKGINKDEEFIIPAGARSQSKPVPGEQPQTFETSEPLKARSTWNNLQVRLTRPQTESSIKIGNGVNQQIYLQGTSTGLVVGEPLLIDFAHRLPDTVGFELPKVYWIKEIFQDTKKAITRITLMEGATEIANPASRNDSSRQLYDDVSFSIFTKYFHKDLDVSSDLRSVKRGRNQIKVFALKRKAHLFGYDAPMQPEYIPIVEFGNSVLKPQPWKEWDIDKTEDFGEKPNTIYLDGKYDGIISDSYVLASNIVFKVSNVENVSRYAYGITRETTKITLPENSIVIDKMDLIRHSTIYVQSEELNLAERPLVEKFCGGFVELSELYEKLDTNSWLILTGEKSDLDNVEDVYGAELIRLEKIQYGVETYFPPNNTVSPTVLPNEKLHTYLTLASKLKNCYKRDTVRIYGNVVKATHGETRSEVLGSGDASKPLQAFTLKQPPLTYTAASNPSGVDSTLNVYVNDLRWHEADAFPGLSPTDRKFVTQTDNDDKTTLTFGNGKQGARLPTGIENIRAEYRNGIGKAGNVKAGRITELVSRLPGLKEVTNPLPATGGADRDSIDSLRRNAPLAVEALDRLVSVQDYEDFTRLFAGIGKARAVELSDGRRQLVHVTIAGVDDAPISTGSDLYRNLLLALRNAGDPYQAIQVDIRERVLLMASANIRILPDYRWEAVELQVRSAVLEAFSFERRELGQDVLLSELTSVIQAVRGVDYVDVDTLNGIPEKDETGKIMTLAEIVKRVDETPRPRIPVNLSQIAFFAPDIPQTLILKPIAGGNSHA